MDAQREEEYTYYYRFVNTAQIREFTPRSAEMSLQNQQRQEEALQQDPEALMSMMGAHYAGDNVPSPFVSLTTDFNLAAQTTDTSPGGLGEIVNNCNYIAVLKVPKAASRGRIVTSEAGLSQTEGEVLYWCRPGEEVGRYLMNIQPNIYKGKYWAADQLRH